MAGENMILSHSQRAFTDSSYHDAYFVNAPHGVCHADSKGIFIDVNPRFCADLGYAPAELIGHRWQEFTHPEDLSADELSADMVISEQLLSYQMLKRYRHKDGRWIKTVLEVRRIPAAGAFEHFVSFSNFNAQITGMVETVEDGEVKWRPSINFKDFVKDNPNAIAGIICFILLLVFVAGKGDAVVRILELWITKQ